MTRRFVLSLVVAVAGGAACSDVPTAPSAPIDRQVTLAPGEATRIADTAATVRFDRVDGDSRCPADALCILGGDAAVRITVTDDGPPRDYTLHTGTMAPVRHGALTIALVELAPYPFSAHPIPHDDYRATLRVTR